MDRGHSVTAFVRSPNRLEPWRDRIAITRGDLLNSADLESVIRDHDVVVSAFGARTPISIADSNLLQRFATARKTGIAKARVKRVVVESVAFLFKDSIVPPAYLLGRLFFPGIVADASAMEKVFDTSDLDWTLVRPPELTDKPYSGKYRVRESHLPLFGFKISSADVANFMINVVENDDFIRKIVGISY
jgi:putative NADH-flavin reductase